MNFFMKIVKFTNKFFSVLLLWKCLCLHKHTNSSWSYFHSHFQKTKSKLLFSRSATRMELSMPTDRFIHSCFNRGLQNIAISIELRNHSTKQCPFYSLLNLSPFLISPLFLRPTIFIFALHLGFILSTLFSCCLELFFLSGLSRF